MTDFDCSFAHGAHELQADKQEYLNYPEEPYQASSSGRETKRLYDSRKAKGGRAAGYLFMCNTATEQECLGEMLCGEPDHGDNLKKMQRSIMPKETLVFLFNFETRCLFGPFSANGKPDRDIVPDAWRGRYGAQVQIQPTKSAAGDYVEKILVPTIKIRSGRKSDVEVSELMEWLGENYSPTTTPRECASSAGYLFMCNERTEEECFDRLLLGDKKSSLKKMQSISADTQLFLFNFESKRLSGPFQPDGAAGHGIVEEAWNGRFPAQVRFRDENDFSEQILSVKRLPAGRFLKPFSELCIIHALSK